MPKVILNDRDGGYFGQVHLHDIDGKLPEVLLLDMMTFAIAVRPVSVPADQWRAVYIEVGGVRIHADQVDRGPVT